MAMRNLVSGAAACGDSSSSSANPLASLAYALVGSSSKTQRPKEISTSTPTNPASQFYSTALPVNQLPGFEFDKPLLDANSQAQQIKHELRR